jgi:hypothetical protein
VPDYNEPDKLWQIFVGINTFEDYQNRFVVKGNFRSVVHNDVRKEYETTEYLMTHAWYHYPMYDEALKKLLGIWEMAIKLRCTQLGISLKRTTKKGKVVKLVVDDLIKSLCEKEPAKKLEDTLQSVREIRNIFAHPERSTLYGATIRHKLVGLVNLLNAMFVDEKEVEDARAAHKLLLDETKHFEDGLLLLTRGGERYLIASAQPVQVRAIGTRQVSYWHFKPVLTNTFATLSAGSYPDPLTTVLVDVKVGKTSIKAVDFISDCEVSIETNNHPDNEALYQTFLSDLEQLDEMDRHKYDYMQSLDVMLAMSEFEHQYCWTDPA